MNDPFAKFSEWYAEAQKDWLLRPDIVALASATREGRPSVRMVIYRGIREGGFSFFTNYESRKGRECDANPYAAMAFYWPHLGRQIRIEGAVSRLSQAESDSYFESRPLQSQITAVVSRQSRPLPDPDAFGAELAHFERSSYGRQILRPEYWGGFTIVPDAFEFWIHGEHRRHDRTAYRKDGGAWNAVRLYP